MNEKEQKVYLETKLRNLKRKATKLAQHADLTDDYLKTHQEIEEIQKQLN